MSSIRAPWKCPICKHISSRHWNMKLHIEKRHGGFGVAEQIHGRREPAFSQKLNTANFGYSTSQNTFSEYIGIPQYQFFDPRDPIEGTLDIEFEGCMPIYLELERLFNSRNFPEQFIRKTLGSLILKAVLSPNPILYMKNSVKSWSKKITIDQMVSDICMARGIKEIYIKDLLKYMKKTYLEGLEFGFS